jgi:transcription antitermination protein NusB
MEPSSSKSNPKHRRWARRFALQALYQWEVSKPDVSFIEKQFLSDENVMRVDWEYFKQILHGVPMHIEEIDKHIKRYINRKLPDVDPVELSTLRVATYELLYRSDVPYRVILNEALELSKNFGATEGHKFVNGILDKVAREVRHTEINLHE